jgi:hypothetical protein
MVLSLIARNELAVGISGTGLSGPAYRVGGLRGASPALRVLEATVLMRSVMAKIEAGRVEGVAGRTIFSILQTCILNNPPPCSTPVTMPSSNLPAASLSTLFSLPAGRFGRTDSNSFIYIILLTIARTVFGSRSRFLPALREARVGGHPSCPRVALPVASAPAIAGDRSPRLTPLQRLLRCASSQPIMIRLKVLGCSTLGKWRALAISS